MGAEPRDDKAQAAVWIANLIRYRREGFKPDRDIIVALTADEEGGGPYNGVDWLIKNHRELIDAELALNEGGWGESDAGRKVSNNLQVSEKYVINFRFEVHNKGGHSSLPVPDNAIYHLAGALERLSSFGFPLKTNEVTTAYFQKMAKIETGPVAEDLAKVAEGSQEAMRRVAAASPAWNATLRTTCVATQLEGGHAMNALPQLAAATVNCRVLPEDSLDYVQSTLQKVVADDQVTIKVIGDASQGPSFRHAAGCARCRESRHQPSLAGRAGGSNHGDGCNRRKISAGRGHSDLWDPGIFHRSQRYSLPWAGRAYGRAIVLRRPDFPVSVGKDSIGRGRLERGAGLQACIQLPPCYPKRLLAGRRNAPMKSSRSCNENGLCNTGDPVTKA